MNSSLSTIPILFTPTNDKKKTELALTFNPESSANISFSAARMHLSLIIKDFPKISIRKKSLSSFWGTFLGKIKLHQ